MNLQVIENEKGKPSGVFIPIKQWNRLKKQFKELAILENEESSKEQILSEIRESIIELNLIKEGKLKSRPVKDLLDEL